MNAQYAHVMAMMPAATGAYATTRTTVFVMVAYAGVFTIAALHLPPQRFDTQTSLILISIGVIAFWRYSWWAIHVLRALHYRSAIFPAHRLAADAVAPVQRAEHVYVVITSYRIAPEKTFKVYDALVKNAIDYGAPTTIIPAITDQTDVDVLGQVLAANGDPPQVQIRYMFQRGDGKRSAMAEALRCVARDMPSKRSVVVFMDGDIQLTPRALARTVPFFFSQPELAAVTTNNRAVVTGNDWTKEWYDLRYAQRDLLMSSMALSSRLLVLTGRFSVFRADLATKSSFIEIVENDYLEHWRFGRFRLLSGDDKSTWFWLLQRGYRTRYVPDVVACSFEELPDPSRFVGSTTSLMRRWYGNMLRNNGRAIALGPRPMGLFTWWSLIDQRLSMWTSLTGPGVAILLSLTYHWSFAVGYLCWIMIVRVIATLVLGRVRGRLSPLWPVLLYYNQILGGLVKTYVSCRLNQQIWVRQNITAGEPTDLHMARRQRRISHSIYAVQMTAFGLMLAFYTGALPVPAASSYRLLWGDVAPAADNAYWIAPAVQQAREGGTVRLPPGTFRLPAASLPGTRLAEIRGAGARRTTLLLGSADPDTPAGATALSCGHDHASCRLDAGAPLLASDLSVILVPSTWP